MNADLAAIKDAMDKATGDGRDRERAVALADAYVAAHPDKFEQLEKLTIEDCVRSVDVLRAANLEDEHWTVEAWLLHRFDPQDIGGAYSAHVRLPRP